MIGDMRRDDTTLEASDPRRAQVEHLLRRLTMGTAPGRADEMLDRWGSIDAVRDALITAPPLPFDPPGPLDSGFDDAPDALSDADRLVVWWVDRMRSPDAGVHERMMWTWHTLITTSADKAPNVACWRQLRTLHTHALGNFGELLRAMLDDIALFVYLDADGSQRDDPNENLARELLELFTLGRGAYTQADVRAAAHVLAGRSLDWAEGVIVDGGEPRQAQTCLGVEGVRDLDDLCGAILDHEACAAHVVRHLWTTFVGGEPDEALTAVWAEELRSSGYEIAPLVSTIASSDAFLSSHLGRPRCGVEWFVAVIAAIGHEGWSAWDLHLLGQLPYRPPNVAGWPGPARWTSSTTALGRGSWVSGVEIPSELARIGGDVASAGGDALVEAVLDQCSIAEVSRRTRGALRALAAEVLPLDADADPAPAVAAVLRAAALTPEFSLT